MSTPQENAMHWTVKSALKKDNPKEYKKKFYSNGIPRVEGKSFKQYKSDEKSAYHARPVEQKITTYHTDTSKAPKNKEKWNVSKLFGWAGKVGAAHQRNQKAEHEKNYREDYR